MFVRRLNESVPVQPCRVMHLDQAKTKRGSRGQGPRGPLWLLMLNRTFYTLIDKIAHGACGRKLHFTLIMRLEDALTTPSR
jgi:hypothetical protein